MLGAGSVTNGGEAMSDSYPPIPYEMGQFPGVRHDGFYYVDKTRFVRVLEEKVRFAFFVRPPRFGKTLWLTTLNAYYNRAAADEFEAVFAGTNIGAEPTRNHSRYMVLYFDFSAIKQALPTTLEESFERYCGTQLRDALLRNQDLFDDDSRQRILSGRPINQKLTALFQHVRERRVPLCVLIDEYDSFTNTMLSEQGAEAYHACTSRDGFYGSFFGTLKAGTAEAGAIERLFATGVSPVTMDHMTSGFNIAANISLLPEFNEMLGFSEGEVRAMLETYENTGVFPEDALATMREWYGGYRFSEDAEQDVCNAGMALYYLALSICGYRPQPRIDIHVRRDFGNLRHLLSGNFGLLREVIEGTECDLRDGFPPSELGERGNFLTLLRCFGLLTIRGAVEGRTRLVVPNQTAKRWMYGILRDAYRAATVDIPRLMTLVDEMAYHGAWRPVFAHLAEAVNLYAGDHYRLAGVKRIRGFLIAHLAATDHYLFHSERELGGGHADIWLEPNAVAHPEAPHGYLLELKWLEPSADDGQVAVLAEEAAAQLRNYLGEESLRERRPCVRYVGLALVYHGWKLAHAEAVSA